MRGTPAAFAQDIRAARLVLEGLKNGHYEALPNVWEKAFCLIANAHCEGPDHLERLERSMSFAKVLVDEAPEHLKVIYRMAEDQNRLARDIVAKFGRHPHRNAVLGRVSTLAEEAYITAGEFPHERKIPSTKEESNYYSQDLEKVLETMRRNMAAAVKARRYWPRGLARCKVEILRGLPKNMREAFTPSRHVMKRWRASRTASAIPGRPRVNDFGSRVGTCAHRPCYNSTLSEHRAMASDQCKVLVVPAGSNWPWPACRKSSIVA